MPIIDALAIIIFILIVAGAIWFTKPKKVRHIEKELERLDAEEASILAAKELAKRKEEISKLNQKEKV